MKQDNINYTIVGVFVISSSILLLVILFLLTGRVADADRYFTILDDVSGINNGTAVTYNGYKIGQLTAISPIFNKAKTRFELALSVKSGWKISADSTVMITKPGLLSDSQINITEGVSDEILAVNSHIRGVASDDVMASVKSLANQLNSLSTDLITPMITQIKLDIEKFSLTMSSDIPKLTKNINSLVLKLKQNSEVINTFFNTKNQQALSDLISNAETVMKSIKQSSTSVNSLVMDNKEQVQGSIIEMNKAARLFNHKLELILNQLESSSQNISDFSHQIKNNPGVIIRSKTLTDPAER